MKKSLAAIVGALVLLSASAGVSLAQDAKTPAQNPAAAATQTDPSLNMGGNMGQLDEHMKRMQALHDRMNSATTPEERQKVKDEQRQEMQRGMVMMKPMMGGMGGGMMGQKGQPADANAQMQMMQKRMDMMQMMMQTMMDQQGMTAAPRNPEARPTK